MYFDMAGLISQNAVPKDLSKKKKKLKKDEVVLVQDGNEESENELELEPVKAQKRKRGRSDKDEAAEMEQAKEMKRLENSLFGSLYTPVEFGKYDEEDEAVGEVDNSSALFFTDRSANSVLSVYQEDVDSDEDITAVTKSKERKPVWVDEEEEKTVVNIAKVNKLRKLRKEEDESVISGSAYVSRLRAHHIKMNPGTDWARPEARSREYNSSNDEDSDKESDVVLANGYQRTEDAIDILRTNEDLVLNRGRKLLPGLLEHSRLVDANSKDPSSGPVNSVQFHKNAQLLLVGGLDRTLRFFQIDGKKNDKIQSIFLEDCPIRKASFLPDGSHVII